MTTKKLTPGYLARLLILASLLVLAACSDSVDDGTISNDTFENQAQVMDILFSTVSSRGDAAVLDAAEVSGAIYPFVKPDDVKDVEFYLNDAKREGNPYSLERFEPFDFASSSGDSANALDTTKLSEGVNKITAAIRYRSGKDKVVTSTFVVANKSSSDAKETILVSDSGDRANARNLNNYVVNDDMHVFVVPKSEVESVQFFLNDNLVRTERYAFYDFASTSSDGTAEAFDTTQLPKGEHTVRAVLTRSSGGKDAVEATFRVGGGGNDDADDNGGDGDGGDEGDDDEGGDDEGGDEEGDDSAPDDGSDDGDDGAGDNTGDDNSDDGVSVDDTLNGERLKIAPGNRYLQTASGKPAFILADTAWGLVNLNERELDLYFKTRKSQGYNTILGPVVWGSWFKSPDGTDMDRPRREDSAYYKHLDLVVKKAKEYGFYLGMVVQWGESNRMRYYKDKRDAYEYAKWIGNRYKNESHIFWFASGEYTLEDAKWRDYYNEIGKGLKAAVGSRQLVTIHPAGGRGYSKQSSSHLYHNSGWLDFNSIQTWTYDDSTYRRTKDDWNKGPTTPVFMSETKYEAMGPDAYRMRRLAYWSVFSGSFGFGYGHGATWGMKRNGLDWKGALNAPGGKDMGHVKDLIMSRAATPSGSTIYFDRVPDDGVVRKVDGRGNTNSDSARGHVAATRDKNGKYLMIYIPTNGGARKLEVNLNDLSGSTAKAWWYNPDNGSAQSIGTFESSGTETFTTPSGGKDWVLVIDDAAYGWSAPGE